MEVGEGEQVRKIVKYFTAFVKSMDVPVRYWRQFRDILERDYGTLAEGVNAMLLLFNEDPSTVTYQVNLIDAFTRKGIRLPRSLLLVGLFNSEQERDQVEKGSMVLRQKLADQDVTICIVRRTGREMALLATRFHQYIQEVNALTYDSPLKLLVLGNDQADQSNLERALIGWICFRSFDTPTIRKLGAEATDITVSI